MTIKTTYICDICGSSVEKLILRSIIAKTEHVVDVCENCTLLLAQKVIKNELLNLRPWCKKCSGKGFIRECVNYDPCGRNEYEKIKCDECTI